MKETENNKSKIDGVETNPLIVNISPSFNCGCLFWHATGDQTKALNSLLKTFAVGMESVVGDGMLSLGCFKHGKISNTLTQEAGNVMRYS